jgi:branched-chain amino acid transport system ATP-binding protein
MLEVNDIHTYYGNIHALKGISLTVEKGEIVTLIGSNGAGKTTTLRSICGLQKPRQGNILLEGEDLGPSRRMRSSRKGWQWSRKGAAFSPVCLWLKT